MITNADQSKSDSFPSWILCSLCSGSGTCFHTSGSRRSYRQKEFSNLGVYLPTRQHLQSPWLSVSMTKASGRQMTASMTLPHLDPTRKGPDHHRAVFRIFRRIRRSSLRPKAALKRSTAKTKALDASAAESTSHESFNVCRGSASCRDSFWRSHCALH